MYLSKVNRRPFLQTSFSEIARYVLTEVDRFRCLLHHSLFNPVERFFYFFLINHASIATTFPIETSFFVKKSKGGSFITRKSIPFQVNFPSIHLLRKKTSICKEFGNTECEEEKIIHFW